MTDVSYDDRVFWKFYMYACSAGCGWKKRFYLELGLEGPREQMVETPAEVVASSPYDVADEIPATSDGRIILPVPFNAGGCPNCQPGGPPWDMASPTLQHVQWDLDRVLEDPIIGRPMWSPDEEAPHFLYPPDPHEKGACGRPVIPGYAEADRFDW